MRYIMASIVAFLCASCSSTTAPQATAPLPTPSQGPIITQIVSRNQVLIVRAGVNEPTYSVQSKNGEVLVPATTAGDLAVSNPHLLQKVRTMQAASMDASADSQ